MTPKEIHKNMVQISDEDSPSYSTMKKWNLCWEKTAQKMVLIY